MLRTFQPADKTILVKGSTSALKVAGIIKKKLEFINEPTMQIDTFIGKAEGVKEWLDKNCSGDRGLLGEIEVSHEMAQTMTLCCRLHEKEILGIESEQESLELTTDNSHARLIEIRALVARLADQSSLSLEEHKAQKAAGAPKPGRRGRPGEND